MPRPLAIKSWAKQALYENKQDKRDLEEAEKGLERLAKTGADKGTVAEMKKRIEALKKRVLGASR